MMRGGRGERGAGLGDGPNDVCDGPTPISDVCDGAPADDAPRLDGKALSNALSSMSRSVPPPPFAFKSGNGAIPGTLVVCGTRRLSVRMACCGTVVCPP